MSPEKDTSLRARNGVYVNVVERIREAFRNTDILRLDCGHVYTSDYKKIGVKLRWNRAAGADGGDDAMLMKYLREWRRWRQRDGGDAREAGALSVRSSFLVRNGEMWRRE
ncbi:hypothetical protein Cni_G16871 [Canna indica]|uniref:Uncharacterized protein n=1 Tax=Canna indica TaxID=4628 RepID=A0AAQ3KGR8_9LILI|nr:hypothetical protein Cni_G16871 [Canna indica]